MTEGRTLSVILLLSSLSLCFLEKGSAVTAVGRHSVHVASLFPATTCSTLGTRVSNRESSVMKVVHRHGPCAKLTDTTKPTLSEILTQDELRVKSIQRRARLNSGETSGSINEDTDSVSIPAKSGSTLGTGNYIVTVGLGTPKRDLSLIFDTGSDITWTQCQPCAKACYSQQEPIFDPSSSRTYRNVSCNSPQCSQLESATGNPPTCAASTNTCIYGIRYGDQSFSVGYLATETLTLSSYDVLPNLVFGCGENNQGLFRGAAGLIGLGRHPLSLVSQTASKYGQYFSYCLPSPSGTGHLTLGKGKINVAKAKFTRLRVDPQLQSFYFVDVTGIKVGAKMLPISNTVFSNAGGTVVDSGTVITRLPPTAYSALRSEFRKQMSNYKLTTPLSLLDTCYDFTSLNSVQIPKISIFFTGNTELALQSNGILFAAKISQVCLAFAGNDDDTTLAILGNVQQQSLEVIYDIAGGKLGFAAGSCS